MSTETDNFKFHYDRLSTIANTLNAGNVDIDQLEDLIKQSVESKNFCSKRIENVRESVKGLLNESNVQQQG